MSDFIDRINLDGTSYPILASGEQKVTYATTVDLMTGIYTLSNGKTVGDFVDDFVAGKDVYVNANTLYRVVDGAHTSGYVVYTLFPVQFWIADTNTGGKKFNATVISGSLVADTTTTLSSAIPVGSIDSYQYKLTGSASLYNITNSATGSTATIQDIYNDYYNGAYPVTLFLKETVSPYKRLPMVVTSMSLSNSTYTLNASCIDWNGTSGTVYYYNLTGLTASASSIGFAPSTATINIVSGS